MIRRIDSKGVIAVIAAVILPVLLLLASGGFDIGRAYVVKQRLQTAVDAAALVAQVNAANATPETACQSTSTMNAALLANLTSNGFLSISTPTIVNCNYDATTKKIAVTGTVNLNKTLGFAPSSVTATGYATIGDDQDTSPWMYQFKTQNSNCQYNGYLQTLSLTSSDKALIMSGPVQNNCHSTDWTNTTSIVPGGGGTSITTFNVTGNVTMNGTQGASLCHTSYYLCANNDFYIQGNVIDNIPIFSGKIHITSGTTLSSTLSSPEILQVTGGEITGDSSLPVTLSNLNINTNNTYINMASGTLNIENGTTINYGNYPNIPVLSTGNGPATVNLSGQSSVVGIFDASGSLTFNISDSSSFQGNIIFPQSPIINLSNKSSVMLYNSGTTSVYNMKLSIDNSKWTYENVNAGWPIYNGTITLSNSAKMTSAPQNNVRATLSGGSTMNFVTSATIQNGTYTLTDGSTLDLSSLSNSGSSTTVILDDTSKIIVNQITYSGSGSYKCANPSYPNGPPICTKQS